MENRKRKSTGLLLSILGVISLVLITAGVTYAFFSYAKQGTTINSITTGTINFLYDESGTALTISNALPQSDSEGIQNNSSEAFTFSVTSTTPSTAYINYIVTARMDATSTLPQNQVKLYITSTGDDDGTNGNPTLGPTMGDTAGSILTFAELTDASSFTNILKTNTIGSATEKVLYVGQVPTKNATNNGSYTRNFRLNMWLAGNDATYECQVNGVKDSQYETQEACEAVTGGQWVNTSSNSATADYSAYEFVKVSSIYARSTTQYKVVNEKSSPSATDELVKGTDILTSVDYYTQLEASSDQEAFKAQYTRIAAVNQAEGKIYTVVQSLDGGPIPTTTGWAASEQYYPLNGGTFKVTINVYAEGATTYSAPSNG